MANTNLLSGFAPVRYRNGSPWSGAGNLYCIAAANTNAFWIGDPVTTIGAAGGDAKGIPYCTLGVTSTPIRGVIVAIGTSPNGGPYINPGDLAMASRPLGAAVRDYYALVVDDPNVFFEIQEGGSGSALTAADVNRNVSFNTGTRNGTPVPVLSPSYLDIATVATTAARSLKIQQLIQRIDNAFGTYAKWLVSINNHEFGNIVASS